MKSKIVAILVVISLFLVNVPMAFGVGETINPNPINFMCSSSDSFLIVSWKNPDSANITSIKLYDNTSGVPAQLTPISAFATTSNAYNKHMVGGLANGSRYIYRLEMKFSSGEDVIVETSGIPENGGHQVSGWTTHTNYNQETVGDISVQSKVTRSGNGALLIRGNQGAPMNSHYMKIYQNLNFEAGANYSWSFWIKAKNLNHIRDYFDGPGNYHKIITDQPGTWDIQTPNDWTQVSYNGPLYIRGTQEVGFIFDYFVIADECYIDDVVITKDGGNGTNLYVNGDFETNMDKTAPGDVTGVAGIYNDAGKLELNWTNPTGSDFQKVNIYQKEGTDLYYRKSIFGGTQAIFDELTSGKQYTYVLKAADAIGNESTGIEVTPKKAVAVNVNPNPVNFMCSTSDGFIIVSWKNPTSSNITAINLYDVTTGTPVEIAPGEGNVFSTGSAAYNSVGRAGLINGTRYIYRLVTKFASEEDVIVETSGVPSATGYQISGWNLAVNNAQVTVGDFSLQGKVTHSGNGALSIRGNQGKSIPNSFIKLFQNINIESGANYAWSFWIKAKNLNHVRDYFNGPGVYHKIITDQPGTWDIQTPNDWLQISYTGPLFVSGAQEFGFILDSYVIADECYIDDVVVTKVGGNGSNLYANGDFETGADAIAPSTVTDFSATAQAGVAEFVWSKPLDEDYSHTNIYQKANGILHYRKSVYGDDASTTLGGLYNGKEYEFVAKAVDAFGNESAESSVLVTSIPPALEVGEFALYEGASQISNVKQGNLTVKINVKNNQMGNAFTPCFMVGLYDGNKLTKLVMSNDLIPQVTYDIAATELILNINVDGNYKLRAFLWDSAEGMGPLKVSREFQ